MDRTREVYEIIVAAWKFFKPYAAQPPQTDAEWDTFFKGISAECKNIQGDRKISLFVNLIGELGEYIIKEQEHEA